MTTGWENIAWQVLTMVLGVLSTVAVTVLTAALYKYLGLRLDDRQQDMLKKFADRAVAYAEQQSLNGNINKDDRGQVAVDFLLNTVDKSKVENIAATEATKLIETSLGLANTAPPVIINPVTASNEKGQKDEGV